jgi:predicted phosphodiesterase
MTVVAVFSDLHGNTPALEEFFSVIRHVGPDLVVNLGDIASGGLDPRGTLDALRSNPEVITIAGNHERQLLTYDTASMGASDRLAAECLDRADREWIQQLPQQLEIAPGVLAFHGAPGDDLCYLLETVEEDGLREATDDEVIARLGDTAGKYSVYLCGHTHLQRLRRIPGGSIVANPGSLGWPAYADDAPFPHKVEAGTPHARFLILRSSPTGWEVELRAIDYDVEAAATLADRNGRDDIAHALRTGTASLGQD